MYVGAVEALRKKKKRGSKKEDEAEFSTRNGAFLSFTPLRRLMYFFGRFFLKISPGFGPNSGFWCRVFLTLQKTLMYREESKVSYMIAKLFFPKSSFKF
jgi:hypothetical protein